MIDSGSSGTNPALTSRIRPLSQVPDLATVWQALENLSECSFFQSWLWIGTWLDICADRENLQVFDCRIGDDLVALAILGKGTIRRRGIFTSRQLVLNQSTNRQANMFLECNELLCRRGHDLEATRQLVQMVRNTGDCEELRVDFGPEEGWTRHASTQEGIRGVVDGLWQSWSAPLSPDTTIESILLTLSSSRRSQLRRTIREFEMDGSLSIASAGSREEALEYFQRLGHLHTERWHKKGIKGSFSNPSWMRFHSSLIEKGFDSGVIQLLRIRCGDLDIGYIYNFLWRGKVLMLQTGFRRDPANIRRSGYVSHLLAMQFNGRLGMREYDFLPGDHQYKRALAKQVRTFVSIRFQRKKIKFTAENVAVWCVRKYRKITSHLNRSGDATMRLLVGLLTLTPSLHLELLALLA